MQRYGMTLSWRKPDAADAVWSKKALHGFPRVPLRRVLGRSAWDSRPSTWAMRAASASGVHCPLTGGVFNPRPVHNRAVSVRASFTPVRLAIRFANDGLVNGRWSPFSPAHRWYSP